MTTPLSYVLPLRWQHDEGRLPDLSSYLRWLSRRCEVIVVDGSPDAVFKCHHLAWSTVTHCRPDPVLNFRNGKVNGVITGVRKATRDLVVIADDDVRYDDRALDGIVTGLAEADAVVPQNVFMACPWHARCDTARSLLNRAWARDYPGTIGVRRDLFIAMGGYDGDVLFENLELLRTVRAFGGRVLDRKDLPVGRLAPTAGTFASQRVRQAYDSLGQPIRLAAELALLPVAVMGGWRRLPAFALAAIATAEIGRRRGGGRAIYPPTSALWAPAWLIERAVCAWLALGLRGFAGGVRYAGSRITVAAHTERELRRRLGTRGPESRLDVAAVAEGLEGGLAAAAQRDSPPTGIDHATVLRLDPEVAADQ